MADESSQPWTILRLINWTTEYFSQTGLEQPRLSAEILLAHTIRCRRIELYTRFSYEPTESELAGYRRLVTRAAEKEPVAYLVGEKEFYSMRFKVTPDVLIPRPETESLVSEAVAHLRGLGRAGSMWDVCTGSGCVAIATAKQVPDVAVLATDISPRAIAVANENAATHGVQERVRCRPGDLLTPPGDVGDIGDLDVIAANPPYVAENQPVEDTVKYEPPIALKAGREGLDFIRPIINDAPNFLRPGGMLVMEFGCGQADAVRQLTAATGCFAECRVIKDHQGIERTAATHRL